MGSTNLPANAPGALIPTGIAKVRNTDIPNSQVLAPQFEVHEPWSDALCCVSSSPS